MQSDFVLKFSTDPQGSSYTSDEEQEGFKPSVWPPAYDPSSEDSIHNAIGDCDKWVLQPWHGFGFHVPAITYRDMIIQQALASLPDKYKQAKDTYNQELLAYLAKQQANNSTNVTKIYAPPEKQTTPALTIALTTNGVTNYATYGSGNSNPSTSLSVNFHPNNKDPQTNIGGSFGNGCSIIPWEVFYEGKSAWQWHSPLVYEQWGLQLQTNWLVAGTDNSYPPVQGVKCKFKVGTSYEFLDFYVYYDPAVNSNEFPTSYALKPISAAWDYIVTPTRTIEVQELFKAWYVPDPINPLPVTEDRVQEAPPTFGAMVLPDEAYLRLALGYLPPSGIKDYRSSYQGGIKIDITNYCKYIPSTTPLGTDGKMTVKPVDFVNQLHESFVQYGAVDRLQYGQHGVHTLEIINMGTQGYFKYYDERARARKTLKRKTYSLSWYVPSLDNGEYLYRKRWGVFNPADLSNIEEATLLKTIYLKEYGNVGLKRVLDIKNPFDTDVYFVYDAKQMVQNRLWYDANGNSVWSTSVIRIPADSTTRVTTYGHRYSINAASIIMKTPEVTAALAAYKTDTSQGEDVFGVNYTIYSDALIKSRLLLHLPQLYLVDEVTAVVTPVIDKAALGNRFPIRRYDNYYGSPMGGQNCTCNVANRGDSSSGATVDGHYRLYSNDMNTYLERNRKTPSHATAYISPNIERVYQCPNDPNRRSAWHALLFESTAYGLIPYPLGGAVDTFCEMNDSQALTPVTMATPVDIPSQNNYSNWNDTGLPVEPRGCTSPTGGYTITNIVLDSNDNPIVSCAMVGKVVLGWDEMPIEVHYPPFIFSTL